MRARDPEDLKRAVRILKSCYGVDTMVSHIGIGTSGRLTPTRNPLQAMLDGDRDDYDSLASPAHAYDFCNGLLEGVYHCLRLGRAKHTLAEYLEAAEAVLENFLWDSHAIHPKVAQTLSRLREIVATTTATLSGNLAAEHVRALQEAFRSCLPDDYLTGETSRPRTRASRKTSSR